jgi:hypothetical protein
MPKSKKKVSKIVAKRSKKLFVVRESDQYTVFTSKPVATTENEYNWATGEYDGEEITTFDGDYATDLCLSGFEGATGIALPEGVVATVRLVVEYKK